MDRIIKNVISSAKNRLIAGLMMTGVGIGMVASAYIRTDMQ